MKLEFKVRMSDFDRKMALFKRAKKGGMKDAVQKASAAYARTALLYTPPGMKSKRTGNNGRVIGEYLYFRILEYLPDLAKKGGKNFTAQDREELKKGNLFRMMFRSSRRKKEVFKYYKSAKDAEPERKIATRGLYKAGYAINFPSIGLRVPPAARALARESPRIQSLAPQINQIRQRETESTVDIHIRNAAYTEGAPFAEIAKRQGENAGRRTLLRISRKFFKERNIKL